MKKTFLAAALISSTIINSPVMASNGKAEAGVPAASDLAITPVAQPVQGGLQLQGLPVEILDLIVSALAKNTSGLDPDDIGSCKTLPALYNTSQLLRAVVVANLDAQGVLFGLKPPIPIPGVQYVLTNRNLVNFNFALGGNMLDDDVEPYIRRARHSMMHLRAWADGFEWRKVSAYAGHNAMNHGSVDKRFATVLKIGNFAMKEFKQIAIAPFTEGMPENAFKERVLQQERKSLLGILACKTMMRISLDGITGTLSGAVFLGSSNDLSNLVNAVDECYANRALSEAQKARVSVMACGLVALLSYKKAESRISAQIEFYDQLLDLLFITAVKYQLIDLSPSFLNIDGTAASFDQTNM